MNISSPPPFFYEFLISEPTSVFGVLDIGKGLWGAPHYSLYGGAEASFIRKRVGGRRITLL
jgi:hypothetical protein